MSDENQHPITHIHPDAAAASSASVQHVEVPRHDCVCDCGDMHVYATDGEYLLRNCIRLKRCAPWPVEAPWCRLQGVLNCPLPGILQRARYDPKTCYLQASASIPLKFDFFLGVFIGQLQINSII